MSYVSDDEENVESISIHTAPFFRHKFKTVLCPFCEGKEFVYPVVSSPGQGGTYVVQRVSEMIAVREMFEGNLRKLKKLERIQKSCTRSLFEKCVLFGAGVLTGVVLCYVYNSV